MRASIVFVAIIVLALAGCSSDDEAPQTDAGVPAAPSGGGGSTDTSASELPTAVPTRSQRVDAATTNRQSKQTCDWFVELMNDVNAGQISGVQGDVVSVGETRYRIKNMYGLSIGSDEPIHPSVKALMAATQLEFKFEDVRTEIDALRAACEQHGFPIPELAGSSGQ